MADKVKVTAVSALAEGFCPLEIRVGQVPEVDHIGMAKHAPQLHQAALLEYVPVKASCGMNRVLSIIFSLCVVVHLLAVLHVLWGYKDQLHIVLLQKVIKIEPIVSGGFTGDHDPGYIRG